MRVFSRPAVVAVLAAALLAACDLLPIGYTDIRAIVASPPQFEGREVKIRGTVTDVVKVPLIEIRVFVLDDGTGRIPVQTSGTLPALKQSVSLKGRIESAAIIGGQSLGLRVMETERLRGK